MAPLAVVTALVAVKKAVVVVLGIAPVGVPQAVLALGPVGVPVSVEVPPVPSLPAVNGALMGRGAEEPARDVSAFPVLRAVRRAAVMPRADRSVVVPAPKPPVSERAVQTARDAGSEVVVVAARAVWVELVTISALVASPSAATGIRANPSPLRFRSVRPNASTPIPPMT